MAPMKQILMFSSYIFGYIFTFGYVIVKEFEMTSQDQLLLNYALHKNKEQKGKNKKSYDPLKPWERIHQTQILIKVLDSVPQEAKMESKVGGYKIVAIVVPSGE
ncbi:hypothetical protein TURU_068029 [Turdus rufiventris]|nr:hypothetical protein TURU_068029 [Turdus rufiventris]